MRVSLETEEGVLEEQEKRIGLRHIRYEEDFRLWVNGEKLRLWGANLVPLEGLTHCFKAQRAERLLQLAVDANMNCLRFWGGGEPLPEALYDLADEKGLLVWAEFFHNY